MTDEQKQQINDANKESTTKRQQLFTDIRNGQVERTKYREKLSEISKTTEEKIHGVLSKDQQAQFEKMKGEKFEMPARRIQRQAVPGRIQIRPGRIPKKPAAKDTDLS